ncbi:hypothetical protein A3H80_03720 [Candidatus Roizmanbacteria bacterium RIFCSPLOWO2_02_FULL_37_19]|uniref:Type II secretion system protein GspG C-terminal domain-containing protein n=1 Tax=Candidatus Roizmanbacteria bacterium RIFCSPHIGHO2_02_FULL_37_24 TaxID=1802037 RepID=A0A1F7GWR2_9BACT|nr:MAG: hypothetical protein A2862_01810 [Candidatus Roizmanbacteria bacterium RIFCSPHIGHO2_01_FULL_38_41]OGK22922.1 MAG: hypothetical protein A3C24_03620 [Candidatus Roizmanbacteria bacterium RIFCSPHIGHO2_02_FULL_37_24]OGK33624.1 MAG: hypothetical protein A3E10_05165 [Candidatus Roizmanbacteria bacterium RIFCSPHIGHO2_12_FULL_37_23]OGK44973.1 MAG: hypothetical protein A2956_00315 [Candidatus Roizmanbacteria bacterium RIFCSPLOWO2_01_FULL_37_57]OGK55276.1 MAG: hypothetical protein A3H80_03720 [Ca
MRKYASEGFTLFEMLIVLLILSTILSIATVSFFSVRRDSRDSRRKTDLEEVRSALEQYRSNNNIYPTPTGTFGLPFGQSGLTDDDANTYVQLLPQDPLFSKRNYYYQTSGGDYTLSTELETAEPTPCATPPGGDSCGSGLGCNYCLGSYGKK